jgi:hypothetical protein
MSISLACQQCGCISTVPDEFAGDQVRCRKCWAPSEVPEYAPARGPASVARRDVTMNDIGRVSAYLFIVFSLMACFALLKVRRSSAFHRPARPASAARAADARPYDASLRAAVAAYLTPDEARGLDAALDAGRTPGGLPRAGRGEGGRTGQRPKDVRFRDSFGEPYKASRKPGMTHDEAVARLAELQKF